MVSGVKQIAPWTNIDWRAFFQSGADIDICVSYGRSWAYDRAALVLRSTAEAGHRVRVTLLDPEGPQEILAFYAHAFQSETDKLRERIVSTIGVWKDAAARLKRDGFAVQLVVEGLSRPMPYTFYRCGSSMWLVFSPRRQGRYSDIDFLPAIRCERLTQPQGLFNWAWEDLEACRRDGLIRVIEEIS